MKWAIMLLLLSPFLIWGGIIFISLWMGAWEELYCLLFMKKADRDKRNYYQ